tara:strand:- start:220 stop:405 length:186 start_codon:yes stop_codon:yes gene_type:complete
MILIILSACFFHKTTLHGVVDYVEEQNCAIELNNNEVIIINSNICKFAKEGDVIHFYVKKK